MKIPDVIPVTGFYYHYKHDPSGKLNNYAYEVLDIGFHTEDDCRPEDVHMVVYRPLYVEAGVFKAGKFVNLRPLAMFMEEVSKDGKLIPRFTKITDPETIRKLGHVRRLMYDVPREFMLPSASHNDD